MLLRLVTTLVAALLAFTGTAGAAPVVEQTTVYQGEINGARFVVKVPADWNGTLVLWSHGWYGVDSGYLPEDIEVANSPLTAQWWLDHGYALAASQYHPPTGWVVEQAVRDQLALLDWVEDNVGEPRRTISTGVSMGGLVSVLVAERAPRRFDGVAPLCGALAGSVGFWNVGLDRVFALRTLLAPELELVHPRDPAANVAAAVRAIETALQTPQGRARLALVGALTNAIGWSRALEPQPVDVESQVRQQAVWTAFLATLMLGRDRTQLEQQLGGNPVGNVGVDYRRQFMASAQRELAARAYAEAGLSLQTDLDALNAAPRIRADRRAAARFDRYGTPRGRAPWPVLTLHTTGDSGVPTDNVQFYAEQVRRGDLRQLYVERGQHCAFSAAEEIVTMQALLRRMDTGRWGDTSPAAMAAAARAFGPDHHTVFDWAATPPRTGIVEPGFVLHRPPPYLRPAR